MPNDENTSSSSDTNSTHENDETSTETPHAATPSMIKIYARVRPPKYQIDQTRYFLQKSDDVKVLPKIGFRVPKDESQGIINNSKENYEFKFDKIFDVDTKQEEIFDVVAKDVVLNVLDGYNGTIFAYGQTGSGKTFTITGGAEKYSDRGLIPRSIQFIFKELQKRTNYTYEIKISYLEIYNESGYDLLDTARDAKKLEDLPKVTLQEDSDEVIHLRNLSSTPAANEEEALNLLFVGDTNKMIAETPSNPASSRSHCIFIIALTSKKEGDDVIRRSKLHLVDLAGSERTSRTQIAGNLLKEAKYINLSLHFLEQVIVALHQKALGKRAHIPYRNSMMTSVLRDSLGGNCKTTMIATAAVEDHLIDESISTCRFAQRVALISNNAKLNEEMDPHLVIARLKREIVRLKAELAIARGEGEEGSDELPDYEIERIKQNVDEYINDTSKDSSLVYSDFRKISKAFQILKDYVIKARNNQPISTTSISRKNSNNAEDGDEIEKLKFLVAHRDNEINVLVGIINQLKNGKTNSTDVDALLKRSPSRSQPSQQRQPTENPPKMKPVTKDYRSVPSTPDKSNRDSTTNNTQAPNLSEEKAKAFEIFKSGYPAGSWIDGQKQVLKVKYSEAKNLGEKANSYRNEIKSIKQRMAAEGSTDENDETHNRDSLGIIVIKYKESYQQLKDLKIEIEHLHHLLDQARLRLTRDFEHWYASVYLTARDQDRGQQSDYNPSEYSDSLLSRADSGKDVESVTSNTLVNSSRPTSRASSTRNLSKPVNEDIEAFYRMRENVMKRI